MTFYTYLPAAGVVPAARARVAGAGALHHPAALLAGGAQLPPLEPRRDHRRVVRERCRGGLRLRRGLGRSRALTVPVSVALRVPVALVREERLLRLLAGPDLGGQDAQVLELVEVVDEAAREPAHDVVGE